MITSITHKGLKRFYENGDGSRLNKNYLIKLELILSGLDAISEEKDILSLRKNVHKLKGNYDEYWSVTISGNLRLVF